LPFRAEPLGGNAVAHGNMILKNANLPHRYNYGCARRSGRFIVRINTYAENKKDGCDAAAFSYWHSGRRSRIDG
jgi:hypothetical protein